MCEKERTSAVVHMGIYQAKNCLEKKENIAQNSENCVTEGKGNKKEKREERQIGRNLLEKKRPDRVIVMVWEEREKVKGIEEVREL